MHLDCILCGIIIKDYRFVGRIYVVPEPFFQRFFLCDSDLNILKKRF